MTLKASGISLELGFNFDQCKLTKGLEHEESHNMKTSTVYHDTLEWYNKLLFSNQEGDEDEKELIQMDDNKDEDDLNIMYCRRQQWQWEEESYLNTCFVCQTRQCVTPIRLALT